MFARFLRNNTTRHIPDVGQVEYGQSCLLIVIYGNTAAVQVCGM